MHTIFSIQLSDNNTISTKIWIVTTDLMFLFQIQLPVLVILGLKLSSFKNMVYLVFEACIHMGVLNVKKKYAKKM